MLFKNKGARATHEACCKAAYDADLEALNDAEDTRSLFDWEGWARRYFAPARVEAPSIDRIMEIDSSDEEREERESESGGVEAGPDVLSRKKPKVKRHRYKLSLKIELLNSIPIVRDALSRKHGTSPDSIDMKKVLAVVRINSGVPSSTLDKWTRKEADLRKLFQDKFNRRRENFGSGQKPLFPKAEEKVAQTIRERRQSNSLVSKEWVLEQLRMEAKKENRVKYDKHEVSDDVFYAFLWRHGFSFRKPSNVKALSKTESVLRMRGFFNWTMDLLAGKIPVSIGETDEINPKFGRFPLICRANSDEVPGIFGGGDVTISVTGEGSTILRVPEQWGTRFCTWRLTAGPQGLHLPVAIVFKGTGKQLTEDELSLYKTLKNVVVLFQSNAWVDTTIELKIVEQVFKPMFAKVKRSFADNKQPFPGILLIEDNFTPHFAEYVFLGYDGLFNRFNNRILKLTSGPWLRR